MEAICNLLKQANLYSIEFTGIFNLKFSISQQSYYYNSIPDIIIELNSGFLIYNEKKEIQNITEGVFNLFGLSVINGNMINGILNIVFENNYSIESLFDDDELIDRNWTIRSLDNKNYIINDSGEIFRSEIFT